MSPSTYFAGLTRFSSFHLNRIDEILAGYTDELGKAYQPYRNHAVRLFEIARLLNPETFDEEKFAVAAAFHDLGIWTDDTWDYLRPSEQLAASYLKKDGKAEWQSEVIAMIHHHHKLTPYQGEFQSKVELFRKADLVDFSAGIIRFELSREQYRDLVRQYPMHRFHVDLSRHFWKHFKRRPWNPFPMVRL